MVFVPLPLPTCTQSTLYFNRIKWNVSLIVYNLPKKIKNDDGRNFGNLQKNFDVFSFFFRILH